LANIGDLYISGIKPVVSTALEASHRLSATGPGVLYYLNAQNYNATGRLLLLIDSASASVPTTTAGLIWVGVMAGLSTVPVGPINHLVGVPPIQFVNGLWAVLTTSLTTPYTVTAAGADMFISALVQLS
jgi:hypothetical protein